MRVPLLDLKEQTERIGPEVMEALRQVVYSGAYVQGPPIEQLQTSIAQRCGTSFAVACSSGTDALLMSLMALGVGPGDEVITTPFSFFATLGSVLRLGATPVLADIEPQSFTISAAEIQSKLSPRTKVIIPVHLYGQCADMDAIVALADRHGVAVLEDAAQAVGASYLGGRKACGMGIAGCLSFYPSKNLGAMGDAGMVVTRDEAFAKKLAVLRNHGQSERYIHTEVGGNFRMDGFQAAVLAVKLRYLDRWTARRQEIADQYDRWFEEAGLPARVGLRPPKRVYKGKTGDTLDHVFHQYVIRVGDRDALRTHLESSGVGTAVFYPVPFHKQPCWTQRFGTNASFPESERASAEVLALPMYPELTDSQQRFVVDKVVEHYASR